jgi:hypothetical protein
MNSRINSSLIGWIVMTGYFALCALVMAAT